MSREYPYSGRDLFENPENYFYAQCASEDFPDLWRKSRSTARRELQKRAEEKTDIAVCREPELEGMSLHSFLKETLDGLRSGETPAAVARVQPFLVKYEIFKKLFSHYDRDLRRLRRARPARLETYLLFARCLTQIAESCGSLKHLSTLLKLCDALATKPAGAFTASEAAMAVEVLDVEAKLVNEIEREV